MTEQTTPWCWTLGDRLRKSRRLAGVSVDRMATELGVSLKTVANYEADRTMPRRAMLVTWAHVCHVPLAALIGNTDTPPSDTPHPMRRRGEENWQELAEAM